MSQDTTATTRLRCVNCGFEAPPGDAWATVEYRPLGKLTQCPECRGTDVRTRG